MKSMIDSILKWWEEHQYDENGDPQNPWNVYSEEPDFVKIAKKFNKEKCWKCGEKAELHDNHEDEKPVCKKCGYHNPEYHQDCPHCHLVIQVN
jgi:formylmethanofuran dehydrogenase subunit E